MLAEVPGEMAGPRVIPLLLADPPRDFAVRVVIPAVLRAEGAHPGILPRRAPALTPAPLPKLRFSLPTRIGTMIWASILVLPINLVDPPTESMYGLTSTQTSD